MPCARRANSVPDSRAFRPTTHRIRSGNAIGTLLRCQSIKYVDYLLAAASALGLMEIQPL